MWAACLLAAALAAVQPAERLAEISVHGNLLTSDAEVIRLAEVSVGMPFSDALTDVVANRLRATKRFQKVEVLKRFASISDLSQVMLVIVVDEGPVQIEPAEDGTEAHAVRKGGGRLMFLPILDYEEGYSVSYGVRLAVPDVIGKARLSFPLTWGGQKRAAAEIEQPLSGPIFTRVQAGGGISERENPYFEIDDTRTGGWGRVERAFGRYLRAGGTAGLDRVSFGEGTDRMTRAGGDVVLDTRLDPFLARDAVYARASLERLWFRNALPQPDRNPAAPSGFDAANRTEFDARWYAGLPAQMVAVVRGLREDSNRPLPAYLMPILGGTANLRGFPADTAVGDTLVGTSVELRVPLSSPLSIGKFGVNTFFDAATVYPKGERLADQDFRRGFGAGVWFSAAVVRLNLSVAHGVGASTRIHLAAAFAF
ncbi:MAG TPA: BamA/TamA family outer membrane protein [Vicinamibacterales bacterium]